MASIAHRQAQPAQPSASQTAASTQTQTETSAPAILRLRGAHSNGRSVQWRSDVVDNEGLGRKKSKVCCIYHRPKGVDESSDDSSSSSSSDSDSDSEPDQDKRITSGGGGGGGSGGRRSHNHSHDHGEGGCSHDHGRGRKHGGDKGNKRERRPSPNAYEKMPKYKPKDGGGAGPSGSAPQGSGGSK
ncbi:type 1 phosphatases regulator ypi-1 [Sordaria brevicollis]|uniref:Type 1 phosphatases regulator n=1 Tax=Sordaria brevicollis TaxID=83679 RepID=A0AAE0PCU7_SORBR|nr:type 1 phosphatases regulator ypi-1 [Sordaria brevicollis]